jgi:PhzF family phenazine biosynthesis protein
MRIERIPIYQADAFTSDLFGGNPAAVCPLKEWLPDQTMQKIAAENNLAETAFFLEYEDGFFIRWFTPEIEIDLCGHATLASAHIIFTELKYNKSNVSFYTKNAGVLKVTKNENKYTLDFPSRTCEAASLPEGLIQALGNVQPLEILKSRDFLLVYENEDTVNQIQPDFNALLKYDALCFIITAPGNNSDFVSRVFAPVAGINEDPVTGSAHCSLIPYWAEKLGKQQLHAYQLSQRRGELWCEHRDDRVLISGNAVTFLQGEIILS